jgi:hypothetical protein
MLPPKFKATAKLEEFLEARFVESFYRWAVPAGPPILLMVVHRSARRDPQHQFSVLLRGVGDARSGFRALAFTPVVDYRSQAVSQPCFDSDSS